MKKRGTAFFVAFIMLICVIFPVAAPVEAAGKMRDITTMELVRDMGIGINLGNTLEACGDWIAEYSDNSQKAYETAWGSPVVTEELIRGYANEGFGVLRIPVAWSNRMSQDGSYKIDEDVMKRVTQIVDWTLDAGMYAIVNIHWDNGWVNTFPDNQNECMKRYITMWEQISDNFKNYDDRLMFESQNEELGWESLWNKWAGTNGKPESYALVNEINQTFVDTIRESGGNNRERHLLISGYNAGIDVTCDPVFKMPSDPKNRCAVSVHYYTPPGFAILTEDADWGKAMYTWGTEADFKELNDWMDMMKQNFVDKGIPVIIGEYGCPVEKKDPDSVRLFLSSVCEAVYKRNMCPVLWDTPGGQYDRETFRLTDDKLRENFHKISGFDPSVPQVTATSVTTPPAPVTTTTASEAPTVTTTIVSGIILGDVDNNGSVTSTDLVKLMEAMIGRYELTVHHRKNADMDSDGRISIIDLIILKNILSK